MKKPLMFAGATVGSYLGWWIGALVGGFTAFVVSMIGFGFGLYAGSRLATRLLD